MQHNTPKVMQDIDNCLRIPTAAFLQQACFPDLPARISVFDSSKFAKVSIIIFDDYGAEEGVRIISR